MLMSSGGSNSLSAFLHSGIPHQFSGAIPAALQVQGATDEVGVACVTVYWECDWSGVCAL